MIIQSFKFLKINSLHLVLLLFFFKTNGQSDNKINVGISLENNLVVGKHLFILSGQSNMVGLKPEESFTPIIEKKYGKEKIIIVKDAKGGQPIRRWYNELEFDDNNLDDSIGNLYKSLIDKVRKAVINKKIKTITFIWMQGERDAREELADYYEKSLIGLLSNDQSIEVAYNDKKDEYEGLAFASINRNCCGNCYSSLPPQLIIDIESQEKLVSCPSCSIFLYIEDENLDEEE